MSNNIYNAQTANLIPNQCAGEYGNGFAPSDPPNSRRNKNVFGLWQPFTGNNFELLQTPTRFRPFNLISQNTGCVSLPLWFHVNIYGVEVAVVDTTNPILPLNKGQIVANKELVAGRYVTHLKARLTWELLDIPRIVEVDIGTGVRLDIMGSWPTVDILAPLVQLTDGGPFESLFWDFGTSVNPLIDNNITVPPGLAINAVIGASVHPAQGPRGSCCEPTYTVTRVRLAFQAGPTLVVPIPSAAKRINIDTDDTTSGSTWRWVYRLNPDNTLPAPPFDAGPITPDTPTFRVEHVEIPQEMQGIYLPPDAGVPENRRWNITFELEL